jgi:hypothetical protein
MEGNAGIWKGDPMSTVPREVHGPGTDRGKLANDAARKNTRIRLTTFSNVSTPYVFSLRPPCRVGSGRLAVLGLAVLGVAALRFWALAALTTLRQFE